MKGLLFLFFVLGCSLPARAHADLLFARWTAAETIESGPLGNGIGTMVHGMMEYRTLPNRRYVILGYVRASNGLFGSARTRAVELARQHGADAIIALNRATRSTGRFLLNGKPVRSSCLVGAYAAIRFLPRKKEKPAWGIADNPLRPGPAAGKERLAGRAMAGQNRAL